MASPKGHAPYNKNGEGGRPHAHTIDQIEGYALEFMDWLDVEDNFWIKDFLLDKRIDPSYMSEWADRSDRFRQAYLLGKQKQESKIIKGGMIGKFNSNIVKLALTNHHGWSDKVEQKITGDAQNPLQCIIDRVSSKKDENGEDQSN